MTITEARSVYSGIDNYQELVEDFIEKPEGNIVAVSEDDGRILYIPAKVEFE